MKRYWQLAGTLVIGAVTVSAGLGGCGEEFSAATPTTSGLGEGGDGAAAAGGGGASASGGSAAPGGGGSSAGGGGSTTGAGGAGQGGGGSGQGGMGGAAQGGGGAGPSCPGAADGCVNDFAGVFGSAGNNNGVGPAARFTNLGDVTGDGTHLYVTANSAVRRVHIASATVTTWAGASGQPGYTNAVGAYARFDSVAGITTNGTTVWVVDSGNSQPAPGSGNSVIRAIDVTTATVTTIAGSPGVRGWADGTGPGAIFDGTRGITFDGTYLYVAETNNNAIRRIHPLTQEVVTVAGHNGVGSANGPGTTAQFNAPRYVHATGPNTLYVGDTENHQIRLVVINDVLTGASTVSTAWGAGPGYKEANGPAALFRRLRGLGDDGTNLVIADSDNFVLRLANLGTGQTSLLAGGPGAGAHLVAIGSNARFNKPMSVHVDPGTGDLFVSEDTVIRRMIRP